MTTISGAVVEGRGQAGEFTQLGWLKEVFQARFGFKPYPGTLNLKAAGAADLVERNAAYTIRIEPGAPGYCAAKALAVKVNDTISAVWIIPEVPGYPLDQVELIADRSLRAALGLMDGDIVVIQVLDVEKEK